MKQGHRSMPILPARDVQTSVDYFVDGLGFSLAGFWKNDDGSDNFAIVLLDGITVGLMKSDRGDTGDEWAAYFYLEDVDVFADEIASRGVKILRGPEDSFYKCREVELVDPSGNRVCFATDLAPTDDGPGL
jgi:predicted enzyme related to lactoylglutathione lyase